MTTPTPDEITAALAVLRASGAEGDDTLDAIANRVSPLRRMAFDLRNRIQRTDPDQLSALQVDTIHHLLTSLADAHGLRITTDPGKLLGYLYVKNAETRQWYPQADRTWMADGLDNARTYGAPDTRLAAVYLLPEGGQA
ncbi:hypothetical protein GV792_04840 [Nocardia cyriacigeorgica]|uniref:hypothetical protein n=1 Tax=Nocardia cyriacigeorgica TaxID=135487 RepID=UPI0013B7EA60|nr:hypothetical protein [Nocardia cyriacigeorgica]NEW49370.1 hypothetical protein [Nocardia cyriacigeorgica]